MKTVIGLFDRAEEAKRAYSALISEGYARADLDILTNDDRDDVPKLDRMHSWVPQPDLDVYLNGVRDGGTIVTANVGDSAVARAASILGSFDMVNISSRANDLSRKTSTAGAADTGRTTMGRAADAGRSAAGTAADASRGVMPRQTPVPPKMMPTERGLSDPVGNDNVLEVVEEDLSVGKEAIERGRMRIYNVVTEREVEQDIALKDETIRVQRRPVGRSIEVNDDLFKPRSFEMVEIDEIANVKKTARVIEEVTLGKDVVDKIQTIKEKLRHQDVKVEEIPAARPYESYQNDFRGFYDKQLAKSGVSYDSLTPAFRFGHNLATREPFRSSPWTTVEGDARRIWEEKNPGTWDQNKPVVKYAWEAVRTAR
jgi:uncharacterized protein (TIGR02271 family)